MNTREIIEYLESCRDTHTEVVEYYDKGLSAEDWIKECGSAEVALGDRGFHQECVDDYNKIIEALQEVNSDKSANT